MRKVKMRLLLRSGVGVGATRVMLTLGLIILCFTYGTAQRDRDRSNKHSNANLEDRRFRHDIHDDDHLGIGHSSGLIGLDPDSHLQPQSVCEPIKIGLCMGIGYNQTVMPNSVGHDAQADAEALLQTFSPLIQYGCSSNLKLLLCSAYVPMCTDKVPQPIGPCRSLCESVKTNCEPVLKEFGFEWPPSLECSKFHPENNHEHLCNPGPTQSHYRGTPSATIPRDRSGPDHSYPVERFPPPIYTDSRNPYQHQVPPSITSSTVPRNKKVLDKSGSVNANFPSESGQSDCIGPRKVWAKGSCYLKCSAGSLDHNLLQNDESPVGLSLFHPSEKVFARNYALLWAVLSLSAAFIALTLSVCSPRFSVAERPILYLALCQVLFSIGVIIGSTSTVSCFVDKVTGSNLLARGGMIPSSCAFVFLLTYFFGTATTMWWIILCLSWLLSLNRNMASSLLQKESSVFHLVSWGVASILTSTALVHKKVDADELTGICGVGFQDMEALSLYNLIPLSISLTFGLMFLTFGLVVRICFPEWNLPVPTFRFLKRKSPTGGQRMAGCELSNNSAATTTASHQTGQTHTQLQSSFRGPHGYSPVLVLPPNPPHQNHHHNGYPVCNMGMNQHHHHQQNLPGQFSNCMCSTTNGSGSGGPCGVNNNAHFYSTGNSPASVIGVGGMQRLRALENTKAIWMRIGIFALVHSLPIACQVGTMVYELSNRENWETGKERPNLQIFLLRLNMNLIAGLTTGVWVLSTYSWKSLLTFTQRFCTCLQFPKKQKKAIKLHPPHEQKLLVPPSVAPILSNVNVNVNLPPIPVPSGSSSSSNNHTSTMPILSSNNTFTARGALAPHNIPSANGNFPRNHYNHPLPPVPPRNPDHIAQQQQRTDAWRRGETIV